MTQFHDANGAEVYRKSDFDGLQVVYDGLQTVHDQNSEGLQAVHNQHSKFGSTGYTSPYEVVKSEQVVTRRICGLRVTTFWLVCVIAFLIVGGATGGGVGGWLASKKSDSLTSGQTPSSTTSSTASSTTSTTPSSTTPSSTTSPTPSNICPSANGTIYTESLGSFKYRILCDSDFSSSGKETLSSIVLSTFDDCLNICNTMNYFQNRKDVGCTYNVEGTGSQTPGTCWCLGGGSKTIVENVGNVVAVPA